jgi:hypothetical protein
MTQRELEERINNIKERILKAEKVVVKNEVKVSAEALNSCGREYAEWDLRRANEKLRDLKKMLEKTNTQLETKKEIESTLKGMPEVFTTLKEELAIEWTKWDINAREQMLIKKKTLGYWEFGKAYNFTQEQALDKTDEEFKVKNQKEAEIFIVDLYNRINHITGKVTSWSDVYYSGKALNGYVRGEKGIAEVETITAGGYNIQRLHLRVLVKELKRA